MRHAIAKFLDRNVSARWRTALRNILLEFLVGWENPGPIRRRPNPAPSNDSSPEEEEDADVARNEPLNPPPINAMRQERPEYTALRKSLHQEFCDEENGLLPNVDSQVISSSLCVDPQPTASVQSAATGESQHAREVQCDNAVSPARVRKSQRVVCCYGIGPRASKRERSERIHSEGRLSGSQDVDAHHKRNMEQRELTSPLLEAPVQAAPRQEPCPQASASDIEPDPQPQVVHASRSAVKRQRSDGRPSGNLPVDQQHAIRTERRLELRGENEPVPLDNGDTSLPPLPDSPLSVVRQSSLDRDQSLYAARIGEVYIFELSTRRQLKRFTIRGRCTSRWTGSGIGVYDLDKNMHVLLPPNSYVITSVVRQAFTYTFNYPDKSKLYQPS